MHLKRLILFILVVIAFVIISFTYSNKSHNDVIRVFVAWPGTQSLPHYEWNKDSEKPTGLEPELIEEILKRAGLEYKYVSDFTYNGKGDSRINVITEGKADISIRGITITEERKQKVLFSKSYYSDGLGIMTNKTSNIKSIDDLNGKKVYAHDYSTAFSWISENLSNSILTTYQGGEYVEPEILLEQGEIDAFIIDYSYLVQSVKSHPTLNIIQAELTTEELGIAISKNRKDLLKKINKALKELQKEGVLDDLKV